MTLQAVIFDIGNVLIEWNPERFYDWQIGRAAREALFAEVDLHKMNDDIDAGALFKETIYDWAARHPDWGDEIRMWYHNWIDMASPRIEGSIALLRALRAKGVPVFALTNFGIHSFAYAQTQYDFLSEFDRAYVSGHMGVIKPDARMLSGIDRLGRRIALALVTLGLYIASSLLMQHAVGPRWGDMPVLALLGYALAIRFTFFIARSRG